MIRIRRQCVHDDCPITEFSTSGSSACPTCGRPGQLLLPDTPRIVKDQPLTVGVPVPFDAETGAPRTDS